MAGGTGRAHRVTSHDVARRAGVSRTTVSHVLGGQNAGRFPLETQERVRAAAAELHYRPSSAGRALVTGRSEVVIVLMPNVTFGSTVQDLIDEIDRTAAGYGLSVMVRYAGRDSAETIAAILQFDPIAVVNLAVLADEDRAELEAAGAAVIPSSQPRDRAVDDIDVRIGETMAEELLRQGPRVLAYASPGEGPADPFGPYRYEGMAAVAGAHGLERPASLAVPFDAAGVAEALAPLAARGGPVGVGCYNDDVAIAVLAGARALGLRVPTDLSVIGVDATKVGQLIEPRLTSVRIDLHVVVARILIELRGLGPDGTGATSGRDADFDLASAVTVIRGETT